MTEGAPRVLSYDLSGSPEFILAYGPDNGPQILVLQPLFEEMNRCRALVAAMCRGLAARGIGCWLPDLPGTGESIRALERVRWDDWIGAVAAARHMITAQSGHSPLSMALRGGALLDGEAAGKRWRLSPTSGRSLLSDLRRSTLMGGGDPGAPAGYRLHPDLSETLQKIDVAEHSAIRTIRLSSDDRVADRHVDGNPLWRRPEPATDDLLANMLIDDIAEWAMT